MKKFALLLAAVLMTAISADVFAQGTGINPGIGETRTYSVNNHDNSTYSWTLTTSATDATSNNLLGDIATGSSTTNSIDVTWDSPTIGTIYYLHVIETAGEAEGGCSNHKVLAIQPANYFEMDIANVNDAGASLDNDFETCAPTVVVEGWNDTDEDSNVNSDDAQDFTYDYGTVTFYYKVTATGITNTNWVPVFTISHNSSATVNAEWSSTIDGTYTTGLDTEGASNTFTVTESNEFFVKVTVANGTVEENLSAEDFTIDLDETASADEYHNIVISTNTDTIDQTITARPNTGDIQY